MEIRFETLDVFTTEAFGGNPLAVVFDAEGLSGAQMQRIAAEFNLSETTFVLPPKDPAHTAEVRIFTPRAEIPFAGHPNVGTAFVLARHGECFGRALGARLAFEEKAGLVEIDVIAEAGSVEGARLAAPLGILRGGDAGLDLVTETCGLDPDDIETARHAPLFAESGVRFVVAELKSRAALAKAAPRAEAFAARLPAETAVGVHLYVATPGEEADLQSRMFAPEHGIPEDPATGAASVVLIGVLALLADEAEATIAKTIGQGVDMGRPSLLYAEADKRGGAVTAIRLGGRCVPMMRGTLTLP